MVGNTALLNPSEQDSSSSFNFFTFFEVIIGIMIIMKMIRNNKLNCEAPRKATEAPLFSL